ncbi:MAG: Integral membrane protein [Candidatus Woesebacteria bacterium GW2011_GWA1_37_8]|uniref:Integral membrane protein n=2 Tax=Candidatus Woeseibacteriota TaxID=1752722 RepID=A0A0G0L707_9BACT|nr:MAG: Integral membrane protein [Microgenomates group bacterium GW2011_GWC1_37_12b]KKQ44965.1 MAG: Integral membrane protein [Candidatus Woesebacteria bacterium GW2011_GWA1_37_8]KKQ87818.1 MAG: Integral membrane protein [Candidatus Woesebacteria bacterium GW2011_GWB1_38_8b]
MKLLKIHVLTLVLCIFAAQSAGLIGAIFTFSAIDSWYLGLNKPFFNPPNWIFGPVWTILYSLIGISLYFVIISKNKLRSKTLKLFFIHLVLNGLWSIIFFGLKNPAVALMEILIMWTTLIYLMYLFNRFEKRAFYLFIPYLLWVTFASILNLSIWYLN